MSFNATPALIYLVDDEFSLRDSLANLFESSGLIVKCFESAESFLLNYNDDLPGCLILDLNMPFMNGLELQEDLIRRNITIPIIFISGNANISNSAKAFRSGALDFLEKPFDNKLLLERVNEAITKDIESRKSFSEKRKIQECLNRLTLREKEVLKLIINSHSNKEAARILDISHRTIDVHRAHVMEKMQADNLAALVSMIMNHDLLSCL